jgi:PAS domain S-box-containing protein
VSAAKSNPNISSATPRAGVKGLAGSRLVTHVLIVEDDEENRNLLRMLLEANAYKVMVAGDGLEALAAARRTPPDVIVSDALMPKMDGFALCHAWMQDARLRVIPFIFYSAAYVSPEDEQFALALGAVKYLIRPLEAEELLRELRAVLKQWVGHPASGPASPLDDTTFHALHESALTRTIGDKIAQLEAANRKLHESEARFRSLTEMSSDFYWESDAEHRVTSRTAGHHAEALSMFWSADDGMGKRPWEVPYVSPDDAGWRAHRAVLDAHGPFRDFEISRLGTDGTERFMSVSGDPVFDASGLFKGYRGVGKDVTEGVRRIEDLQRLRAAMDATNDSIYLTDPITMRFMEVNDAACRRLGYTREQLLKLGPQDVLVADREQLRRRYDEVIAAGDRGTSAEMHYLTSDGRRGWTELHRRALRSGSRWLIVTLGRDITERKRAEEALQEGELQLKSILESTADGMLAVSGKGKVIRANRRFAELWRIPKTVLDTGDDKALLNFAMGQLNEPEKFLKKVRALYASDAEAMDTLAFKDGRTFERFSSPLTLNGAINGRVWSFRDVTERKLAEAKIHRLTQLYAALSQCNEAIVRCTSEDELFQQICNDAVQFGGMKMAWIGLVDEKTRLIRITARFGDRADEYLQGIEISADADSPLSRGVAGTAIRENRPVLSQDFQNEPYTAAWHKRRARFDFRASASLPLHRNGIPVGLLTMYAGEVGAFDEAARKLLGEMATDIDFALDNFAREAARQQGEKNLRAAEEQFRGLVEQSLAGVYILQRYKFVYVNPRLAEILGYACAEDLIGRDALSVVAEKDRDMMLEKMRLRVDDIATTVNFDFTAVRKGGTLIEVGVHGTAATHKGRPAIIGLMQDISDKKRAEEQIQRYILELKTAFMSTVEVATSLSEMRDPYTAGHERHVGDIAMAIGAAIGFDQQRVEGLRVAGFLHDIGKITIPAEILSKPGRLNPIEYQLIKGHPQSGYEVLKDVKFPWPVAEVALQHHERMDGSGYPQGLKGEAILLEARIMAVADVVEAMSAHRPYRPGLGIDKALAEIERGRGSAYDSAVADACLRLFREDGYQLPG